MSLRDTYAKAALTGLLANTDTTRIACNSENEFDARISERCYAIADAMLKERERTNKSKAQKELET